MVGLSLTYNIPKFFELKLIFAEEDPNMFEGLINHSAISSAEHQNIEQPFTHLEVRNITVDIVATDLRLNQVITLCIFQYFLNLIPYSTFTMMNVVECSFSIIVLGFYVYSRFKLFRLRIVLTELPDTGSNHATFLLDKQSSNFYFSFQHYIFIYIFVINCIVNLLIPFILLMILNLKTYKRIQEYEQRLSHFPQFKVIFNRNAPSSNQDFQEEGCDIELKVQDNSSMADDIIETETIQAASRGASLDQPMINDNEELQHDLECFFQETNIGVLERTNR